MNSRKRSIRNALSIVSCLLLTLVLLWSSAARAQDAGPLPAPLLQGGNMESPPYDETQVTLPETIPLGLLGRITYDEHCADCHGIEGNADGPMVARLPGPPTAFADPQAVQAVSPAEWFFTTKYGRLQNMMPPWQESLDDNQIWDAVAYAWSLHTSEANVQGGAALYDASCASCHGENGQGDGPEADAELNDFTNFSDVLFKSQTDWVNGWDSAHPEIGKELSPEQQNQTLEYIRTFSMRPPWESPYEPGAGVITGTVVQGTPGGVTVAGLPVVLDAYVGFDRVATFTSTLDADGGFVFRDLAVDPNIGYLPTVSADGIGYGGNFVSLTPISPTLETEVAVYGTTDDPSGIRINRSHWIIDEQPGALTVGEIYLFGNSGDRTYIGQQIEGAEVPVTIGFRVPDGAEQVQFDNGSLGDRFQQVDGVYYDTMPLVPGESVQQVVVRYLLPFEGTETSLKQEFLYPVDSLSLLVTQLPGVEIEAPQMEFAGQQDIQGQQFQLWRKSAFEPQALDLKLTGLLEQGTVDPRTTTATGGSASGEPVATVTPTLAPMASWVTWLLVGLVVAGLLAGVGFALQRGTLSNTRSRKDLNSLRDSLLDQIAHLDDLHALGELDQATWLRQRAYLKAQLVDVMGQLGEASAATV
ncbi:MAG: c-type cytochrome [Anaerolineales bacterium]|nr:c-type cytochrome [Anaerolineales bacterium]